MAHAAFGMPVFYHSRRKKENVPEWAEYIGDLEEFLGRVDVVSVHIALKEETVGYLDEGRLRAMKRGGILINTARGKVVNEEALIRVLEDGHVSRLFVIYLDHVRFGIPDSPHPEKRTPSHHRLSLITSYYNDLIDSFFQLYAAGLDVYPNEPTINPRLFSFPNVTLLPHMGTETQESQHTMEIRALTNLKDFLTKGRGRDVVPEMQGDTATKL
jgi:glyoxylate reductase